jgi:hypothetical protein
MITIEPMGSHIPVLADLRPRPKYVVEYGAGMQSTRAFLDRDYFPDLTRLVTLETSREYFAMLLNHIPPDPRWDMSLLTEENIHQFTDHARDADLVLIDNHPQGPRIKVLCAVLASDPQGVVAMHDADNAAYQDILYELPPDRVFTPDAPDLLVDLPTRRAATARRLLHSRYAVGNMPATALWFPQ